MTHSLLKPLPQLLAGLLLALAISRPLTAATSALPTPDLTTQAGFKTTCAALTAVSLATREELLRLSPQQLQAWVICKDIALLKQTATWAMRGFASAQTGLLDYTNDNFINAFLQAQLGLMQRELAASRAVLMHLQATPLTPADALHLKPQSWQVDLDGDGVISSWETRFFALPNRDNNAEMNLAMPSDSDAVQMQALIKTDQTDVLWALSYHGFIEGFVEMLRAHTFYPNKAGEAASSWAKISDPAAWTRAHGLLRDGMAVSAAMRESALAETDDDHEWMPNPRQKNSAFPLLLDQGDYDTWGQLMSDMQALWNGKTVLAASPFVGGLLGESARWCSAGTGLDVPKLFSTHPPLSLTNINSYAAACSPISAAQPESALPQRAEQISGRASSGSKMLRYLYWVN